MKRIITIILFVTISPNYIQAQTDSLKFAEKLVLDFPILDFPYLQYSAETAFNKRNSFAATGNENPAFKDYIRSYESVSMAQATAVTKNLHATNYYYQNRLWNNWLTPSSPKHKILNRLAANATAGIIDYVMAYHLMVFGPVWMHEEYHRNGLALQGISSFNETYYRLNGKGIPSGSVSHVLDEDMAHFKAVAPEEMVRSFASGIESQYQLLRHMQRDDFFKQTDYANIAMHILITKQAIDYVNQFRAPDYDASIDTMNYYGNTIPERDFVGWDFTPWVYDLFRPNEPYASRGIHPNGNGIDRVIKRSQLTPEEDRYLSRMADLQYINYLSPFMIGIKRINLGKDLSFNMALHHYPTSFGYNLSADIFLNIRNQQWMIALHSYSNKAHNYPGLEVLKPSYQLKFGKQTLTMDARAMLWIQPENSSFYATKGKAGGLLGARIHYPLSKIAQAYIEVEGKTRGWVAGNPFLKSNVSTRWGIALDIN